MHQHIRLDPRGRVRVFVFSIIVEGWDDFEAQFAECCDIEIACRFHRLSTTSVNRALQIGDSVYCTTLPLP